MFQDYYANSPQMEVSKAFETADFTALTASIQAPGSNRINTNFELSPANKTFWEEIYYFFKNFFDNSSEDAEDVLNSLRDNCYAKLFNQCTYPNSSSIYTDQISSALEEAEGVLDFLTHPTFDDKALDFENGIIRIENREIKLVRQMSAGKQGDDLELKIKIEDSDEELESQTEEDPSHFNTKDEVISEYKARVEFFRKQLEMVEIDENRFVFEALQQELSLKVNGLVQNIIDRKSVANRDQLYIKQQQIFDLFKPEIYDSFQETFKSIFPGHYAKTKKLADQLSNSVI